MENGRFTLIAGNIALDFANTVDNRYDPERLVDLLSSYPALLNFCEQAGVLSLIDSQRPAGRFEKAAAERALNSARELRETIERVFSSTATQRPVKANDLASLNRFVTKALGHRKLYQKGNSFGWRWTGLDSEPEGMLWPIALEAADLLASDQLEFVRECQSETCRWLFLDLSKNHSRRWCDMKLCGNRSKAKRYYEKRS